MSDITLRVPQGVGDIFWIYQKFCLHFDHINFAVTMTALDAVQTRATNFLRLLPKVRHVFYDHVSGDEYQNVIYGTNLSAPDIIKNRPSIATYSCNHALEQGIRLDAIDSAAVDWNVDIRQDFCPLEYEDFVCVYVCGSNKSSDVWDVNNWYEFIARVMMKFSVELPIILIGASYDRDLLNDLSRRLKSFSRPNHLYIDAYPGNVCYILKKCKFFIGYQSGLNILADHLGTRQIMVYLPKLVNLVNAWPKVENINSGAYQPVFFNQTPAQVVATLHSPLG